MTRKLLLYISFLLFCSTLSFTIVQWTLPTIPIQSNGKLAELYDSKYNYITSIEQAIVYADSIAQVHHIPTLDSRAYVDHLDTLLRNRFFHGYSHYSFSDDYIAFLLGKFIWYDLSAIVDPDDILKHNNAACSQQAIVFMQILKKKGYRIQKVGLQGHFCVGVYYEGGWHLYDTNKEPVFTKMVPIPSTIALITNKPLLYKAYTGILSPLQVDQLFKNPDLKEVDTVPARNMRWFHRVTTILSHTVWILFGILYLCLHPSYTHKIFSRYVRNRRVSVL